MPTTEKTLLILANSVRGQPKRCVAGREITGLAKGPIEFGAWVRPVSRHGDGEVSLEERTLSNGREVAVLDIVRVYLTARQGDPLQPENWVIDGRRTWEHVLSIAPRDIDELVEEPDGLWREPDSPSDSISAGYANGTPPTQSLYLIKPNRLNLSFHKEDSPWGIRNRRRARFTYQRVNYDLAITDPTVEKRYGVVIPGVNKSPRTVDLESRCYVCASLAHQPFNGRHYKLVAAIIDPKAP